MIFVIDCSLQAPFDKMRDVLHAVMHNKHIRGKPLLIVANKQDIQQSIDVVDITYFFRIGELCNLLGTPCWIVTSGAADRSELHNGTEWLVDTIVENYKTLKNRMRFNDLLTTPLLKRFKRERTSLPRKVHESIQNIFQSFDCILFCFRFHQSHIADVFVLHHQKLRHVTHRKSTVSPVK